MNTTQAYTKIMRAVRRANKLGFHIVRSVPAPEYGNCCALSALNLDAADYIEAAQSKGITRTQSFYFVRGFDGNEYSGYNEKHKTWYNLGKRVAEAVFGS